MRRIVAIIAVNDADEALSDDPIRAIHDVMGCECCASGRPVEVVSAHWTDDDATVALAGQWADPPVGRSLRRPLWWADVFSRRR